MTIVYNQYIISAYDEMLWLLSLGLLLNTDKSSILLLAEVIDRDNIKDKLFEFLITASINNRKALTEESDEGPVSIRSIFHTLRLVLTEKDSKKSEFLIKKFLNKEWYSGHREASWYDNHKEDTYLGYWCFEAAAITCIKGLDDSSYRDHPYYPKDLADYYRANQ